MNNPPNPPRWELCIEPHGRRLRVESTQTLLDAALAAGLNLPHSCKSGHCASCRARLLLGSVTYPNGSPLGLTPSEAAQGDILLCQAHATSDVTVRARLVADVAEVEIKTLPCRIAGLRPLAPDVMQVMLRLPAVERLRFQPGQYLDVLLSDGSRRSFSIASPPHDGELIELHVRRVHDGDFTRRLFPADGSPTPEPAAAPAPGWGSANGAPGSRFVDHDCPPGDAPGRDASDGLLQEGSLLRIEGPLGQFVWRESAGPVVMIAGGTGFAPLKSMLRHLLQRADAPAVHFYWGARDVVDLYEHDTLLHWTQQHAQLRYTPVLSQPMAGHTTRHRTGWVHDAVLADHPDLQGFEVYAAGPPAMISAVRASLPRAGLDPQRLYFDSFDYAPRGPTRPERASGNA